MKALRGPNSYQIETASNTKIRTLPLVDALAHAQTDLVLLQIKVSVDAAKLSGQDKIGLRVGKRINKRECPNFCV